MSFLGKYQRSVGSNPPSAVNKKNLTEANTKCEEWLKGSSSKQGVSKGEMKSKNVLTGKKRSVKRKLQRVLKCVRRFADKLQEIIDESSEGESDVEEEEENEDDQERPTSKYQENSAEEDDGEESVGDNPLSDGDD